LQADLQLELKAVDTPYPMIVFGLLLAVACCALGWLLASVRLTSRWHTEQVREQRIRVAEQAAAVGTWEWDPIADRFTLSAGAAAMAGLGVRPRAVSRKEFFANVHTDDRQLLADSAHRALATGGSYSVEFRIVPEPGVIRWRRSTAQVEFVDGDRPGRGASEDRRTLRI
jgi:PAS domain-containing protein